VDSSRSSACDQNGLILLGSGPSAYRGVGRGGEAGGSADAEGLRRQLGEGGGVAGVAAVGAEAGFDHGVGDLTEQREVAVGLVAEALRELIELRVCP